MYIHTCTTSLYKCTKNHLLCHQVFNKVLQLLDITKNGLLKLIILLLAVTAPLSRRLCHFSCSMHCVRRPILRLGEIHAPEEGGFFPVGVDGLATGADVLTQPRKKGLSGGSSYELSFSS